MSLTINKIEPCKKKSQFREIWRRMKKNKGAMIGLIIICILILAATFADFIADYDESAIAQNPSERLQPPNAEHWFGTDAFGRDVFARVVHGTRVSLTLGVVTTIIAVIVGGFFGAISGFYGGIVDNLIIRILDTIMCIPPILMALAIVAALGVGMRNLVIAVIISQIPIFARLTRSVILTVVGQEYIEAARACGTLDVRIILRHVIPNAIGPIIVQATMAVAGMIKSIAGLSFIGLGIQPPQPEWGSMLASSREFMRYSPYLVVFPGLAIVLSALSLNLLGDGLRDALDPRLKN